MQFLSFVQKYIPLKEARIGTLGGEGHEASLWMTAGVPARQNWLVERDPARRAALIRNFGSHYCIVPELTELPGALTQRYGGTEKSFLDGFHFDLCGTLHSSMADILPVLPYIVERGRGHCLAITTAEGRYNTALKQTATVQNEIAGWVGPANAQRIFATMIEQQRQLPKPKCDPRLLIPFFKDVDPVKCAQRELGMFWDLLRLLSKDESGLSAIPDAMERYVYISHTSGQGWRMRTYMFHMTPLDAETPRAIGNAARATAKTWLESPLYYIRHKRTGVSLEPARLAIMERLAS